jgi:aryl-alcohol dehydrogenase-like predicted oxidoreductase
MTSVIIGATNMGQLKTDIAAADLTLPEAVLEEIDQIHLDYPNPCP